LAVPSPEYFLVIVVVPLLIVSIRTAVSSPYGREGIKFLQNEVDLAGAANDDAGLLIARVYEMSAVIGDTKSQASLSL
jgi:hypothetical protein